MSIQDPKGIEHILLESFKEVSKHSSLLKGREKELTDLTLSFMDEQTMQVHLSCEGDASVGIASDNATLVLERRLVPGPYSKERDWQADRAWLRNELEILFAELFGEPAHAVFEDECSNCEQLATECKCEEKTNGKD